MRLLFWLARPRQLAARLRYWLWERAHPGAPWFCPGAVAVLEEYLDGSMSALEFGSGRSTAWLAQRVGRLTSVEHQVGWYGEVSVQLDAKGVADTDLRLVPLDHPESEPEWEQYDPVPRYVRVLDEFEDGSLDLIVVDGHYRTTCARAGLPKLKPGGLLMVDDSQWWESSRDLGVPDDWPVASHSTNGLKTTTIWRRPG